MSNVPRMLVDAHCHLDLFPDVEEAFSRCESGGILTVAVTTTPLAWPRNRDLARRYPFVTPALGIHPQLVGNPAADIDLWERYLPEARFIGEVGLDSGPRFHKTLDLQKEIFRRVLSGCAKSGGKVLTVHSVRAVKDVLNAVEELLSGSDCVVILHWFTGSAAEARRALELGCYFSVNAEMLQKEAHRKTVPCLPLDRILTETDGPFTMQGCTPRQPSDVNHLVSQLAEVCGLEVRDLSSAIVANYRRLLGDHV